VIASTNDTPCFTAFPAAFSRSHSNLKPKANHSTPSGGLTDSTAGFYASPDPETVG
jgi:hypothetical protein